MATIHPTSKMASQGVRQTRKSVLQVLHATHFPPVERHGPRGKTGASPDRVIMLSGVLAVHGHRAHLSWHAPADLQVLARMRWATAVGPADCRPPGAGAAKKHRFPA